MKAQINMIGIITSNYLEMKNFYNSIMGFDILLEMENYVEFQNNGVRFAISTHDIMYQVTGDNSYKQNRSGQSLELAFDVDNAEEVDTSYNELIKKGANVIKKPEDMPWGQRAGFFADPDGNIHEIFCNL